jgi:phospholipase C
MQRRITRRRLLHRLGLVGGAALLGVGNALAPRPRARAGAPTVPIDYLVVIYLENRSFDHLFGLFPGAEGLAQAAGASPQVDAGGTPYATLPPFDAPPAVPDQPALHLPALPNGPFNLLPFAPLDQPLNASFEQVNRYYQEQQAIDGGAMDKFVAISGSPTMGYYDGSSLRLWTLAQQYTLADHFFHSAFGGTGLNHFWLVSAATPVWPNAPVELVAQLNADGTLARDGLVTPDGYLVNGPTQAAAAQLPLQTQPHIGDRLDDAGVSWAWYGGNQGQFVDNPLQYFATVAPGSQAAALHLQEEADFLTALNNGMLPNVAFVKPDNSEHPTRSPGLQEGDAHTAGLVQAVMESPYWPSCAIIVTYDEGHSFWDHVPPPVIDRWGPGRRVPAIIISPYAKRGFVDTTPYETVSILRFIEWRWNLAPLSARDAAANNLLNAFDFRR